MPVGRRGQVFSFDRLLDLFLGFDIIVGNELREWGVTRVVEGVARNLEIRWHYTGIESCWVTNLSTKV